MTSKKTDVVEVAEDLRIAVARLQRAIRYNDVEGLSPTMGSILGTIDRRGPIALGDLAKHERMAKPTITDLVVKLERKKLIKRREDKADRRVSLVQITKRGQNFVAKSRARRTAWLAKQLDQLPAREIARLEKSTALLEKLARSERKET
jgi:DNA-binding MarR family transcriptional regulator